VSALVAEDRQGRPVEQLEEITRKLAEHAQSLAGQLADFNLQRLEPEPRDRLQRQIAQEVAQLLAREWLRDGGSRLAQGKLTHVIDMAKRHLQSLPGAMFSPRFGEGLPERIERQVSWLNAMTRISEAAWVDTGAPAAPDSHPDALAERVVSHLARSVEHAVGELTAGEQDREVALRVEQSILGQFSRGYARILEAHRGRGPSQVALERRLDAYFFCVMNTWRSLGRTSDMTVPAAAEAVPEDPVPMI
jgi:hypothetical protein